MFSHPTSAPGHASSGEGGSRISRLLRIVQAIRKDPRRPLEALRSDLGISRSQFYKDKAALAEAGFRFSYGKKHGFRILEDRLVSTLDLSLPNRLILMLAMEQLCATDDGLLASLAADAGRKLAGGMPSPFREQMLSAFDKSLPGWRSGTTTESLSPLLDAVSQGKRIRILYAGRDAWDTRWREIDPRHLYLRRQALYLYARTVDESPCQWKAFRVSGIQKVEDTGMSLRWPVDADDGFSAKAKGVQETPSADGSRPVTIRFTGQASRYVRERIGHADKKLRLNGPDEVLFTMRVADPQEVVRWASMFGKDAEVIPDGEE